MKTCFFAIVVSVLMLLSPAIQKAHAGSSGDPMRDVVVDSLYGAVAGALIGAATLAFVEHSDEHDDNIKIGAGAGLILGATYGTFKLYKGLAQIEDGVLTVQIPTVQWTVDGSIARGAAWNIGLLSVAF
jgi:hypothetical protein